MKLRRQRQRRLVTSILKGDGEVAETVLLILLYIMARWPHASSLFFFKGWGDGHLHA